MNLSSFCAADIMLPARLEDAIDLGPDFYPPFDGIPAAPEQTLADFLLCTLALNLAKA